MGRGEGSGAGKGEGSGQGKGGMGGNAACCGFSVCCCLLVGGVICACIWGITYDPNLNVKRIYPYAQSIEVNLYNRNLYKAEFTDINVRLVFKGGDGKFSFKGRYKNRGSKKVAPQNGNRVSLLTNGDPPNDDEEHYTKVKDKCENKGFIKVKVKGHAKTRPVGGSEKTKTSVQSQWERVDCDFL
mmetsp:Transcript_14293/g.42646  ORF Transcript_14293/g.42646 Transcript_14293/m.42646 type:complete len:185 (+) Transcript_14293:264-818(+)|eukprot:CAMPEP_0119261478 /NCGR_PEP_ID=MMETSP1329-20130426/1533_1 /TAXON_ID=114041 /ORGANISM="Genus nov. species nov., Strain RCC1024" /LENGTH=184 /DNA_ID=CAMNT_0007261043 /DNA_START=262 /DNA_END=816 /DNA_ORIENTATION=-